MSGILSVETLSGSEVAWHGYRLIPFSQAVRLQIPGLPGGLIWNRPVSVLVRQADGSEQVLPVPDPTRQITCVLAGLSLLSFLIYLAARRRRCCAS